MAAINTLTSAFGALMLVNSISCFIIPDEIPSLLSVIYSNIPIIKKGTDSRIGWGFRLGDRADVQFLVELGPQKYTQPLANEPDKVVSNKRNTLNDLASQLWAQRQEDKRKQQEKNQNQTSKPQQENSWLESWSSGIKNEKPSDSISIEGAKPGLAIGEIDAKSVIPPDEDPQNARENFLRSLKLSKNEENEEKKTTSEATTTTVKDTENDVK